VSFLKKLRVVCVCGLLEFALLAGTPMRPEEIRALLQQMNQPALAQQLPSDDEGGEPPVPPATSADAP
jgi:hypothetical protein